MNDAVAVDGNIETDFSVGPQAIANYRRLSYTMWHALAEFIDNSTQSRLNYGSIIDDVLAQEGTPLVVSVRHNKIAKTISIEDNSIGMSGEGLVAALKIAQPTVDSKGRSKYGMGMKTAACWIGGVWTITTCEWASGIRWTATIDVDKISKGEKITLVRTVAESHEHGTTITISNLHRNFQKRTEETIRNFLGSMYRFDLERGTLKLLYNDLEIKSPEDYDIDTDPTGKPMRLDLPPTAINGKIVTGWVAILKKGGRKFGGFSLFQNERQIQGFPNAWKPRGIFGGEDDEGANNLISQRLTGILNLDGFEVSHTKDTVLFQDDEEDELETFLDKLTKSYRDYAKNRRNPKSTNWTREKVRDMMDDLKKEFNSTEFKDAVTNAILPPIEVILSSNRKQLERIAPTDTVGSFQVSSDLNVVVSFQDNSVYEPYVTIATDATPGTIHVIINGIHPYYSSLESNEAMHECMRQYVYDAVAEYRTSKISSKISFDNVRLFKNELLKAQVVQILNRASEEQSGADDGSGASGSGEASSPPDESNG